MDTSLVLKEEFRTVLATEVEKVTGVKVTSVGERFESWDSFAFLVTTENGKKYVGKIFRFPDWPPPGKLAEVTKVLTKHNIAHEITVYIVHNHPTFKFGWQLTEFVEGGNVKEAIENGLITRGDYFKKVGSVLKEVHKIRLSFFGSIHDTSHQYKTFKGLVSEELGYQNFDTLPQKYQHYKEIISSAKKEILKLVENDNFVSTLVHDDMGASNVLWNGGDLILIDWVDCIAGPPLRDFATMTFREDTPVVDSIEQGYSQEIDRQELKLHQLMRLVRLGHFYYSEDKNYKEFEVMMERAKILLEKDTPFGTH